MTPCLLGDCTVLDPKLLVARTSMVNFPCPYITVQELIAKWTLVHKTLLCDNTVLDRKLVPTDTSMVDSSCLDLAVHQLLAKWTCVRNTFLDNNAVLHSEEVPTCPPMIDLACANGAADCLSASRTHILEILLLLRCFASVCRQAGFVAGLGAVLLCSKSQSCILVLGLPHFVFAVFFFRLSFLFSSPFLFSDVILDIGVGHCGLVIFYPCFYVRLVSLLFRNIFFSFPFPFRNGSRDISYDTRLFFCHGHCRYFHLRCS